jgi:hypothetical protein
MTNEQENRFYRDLAIRACIGRPDIALILGAITEYPALETSLEAKTERLQVLKDTQFANLRTKNADVFIWRTRITPFSLQLSAALIALGTKLEDPTILDEAKCSEATLKRLSNSKLVEKTQKLLSLSGTHSAKLAIYQIIPAFLDNYETLFTGLRDAVAALVEAKAEQKQITREIKTTLKEVDDLILRIWLIVETLKESQPVFYGIFKALYHVPDAPTSALSASGYVVDAATGEGIAKCRIKITGFTPLADPPLPSNGNEVLKKSTTPSYTELTKSVKYTSPNAGFRYRNLQAGTYELTAYLAGYSEVKVTFYVNTGIPAEVFIRLHKLETEATAAA